MKNKMKKIIIVISLIVIVFTSFFTVDNIVLASSNKTALGCTITSFSASPTTITLGQSSTLSWVVSDCYNVTISNTNYIAPSSGSQLVSPTVTTTYVLTAFDMSGGSVTQSVTVVVNPVQNNCSIGTFSASPNSINSGSSTTLSWSTSNCVSVSISPNIGNVSLSGTQIISPTVTTTYTLTAQGSVGGSVVQSLTVTVSQIQNCSIYNFNASPNSIDSGDPVTLNWNTSNCNSINISNIGSVSNSGSQTVYPNYTTTYTLTAYGTNGNQQTQSVTVYVNQNQNQYCYINYFTIDGSSSAHISSGDAVDIEWDTTGNNCTVHVSGPNLNSSSKDGNRTVYPNYSGTYTLNIYGSGSGSQTQTVYVNVDDNSYNSCNISYFNASPTSINSGGSSNLSWSTNNCRSVSISNIGSVNSYGSQTVYPTFTTSYILNAYNQNNGQLVTRTVQVYVNNYNPIITPVYNSCAVTGVATNITQNSVTLNGIVTNPNGYNSNTYFEYGTTVSLGSQTNFKLANPNQTFSEILTGLSTNTIYFYRLVTNCNNSVSKGAIEVFKTLGTQTNSMTIVRQGTTIVGTESPIMLKIENRFQSVRLDDVIDYTITYKNISKKTLTHPVLQVILPKGVSFLNSSRGTFSNDTLTLTIPLEDLRAGLEGTVYVQGKINSLDSGNAQIVTTALLVYTSPTGAQENAMAYVLNNPVFSGSSLAGLALFGWFLRIGILGWLLLLIIILLIILLVRRYYYQQKIHN